MGFVVALSCLIAADVGDRFRAEYPSEARGLMRDLADFRGVATIRTTRGGVLGPPTRVSFATGADRQKYEFDTASSKASPKSTSRHIVYCQVGDRVFKLARRADEKRYKLEGFGDDPGERGEFQTVFGKFLNAPWAIGGGEVARQITRDMPLLAARDISEAGRDLVEVEFESGTRRGLPNLYKIAFDPSLHWAIVRAEVKLGDIQRIVQQFRVEYGSTPDGATSIKRIVHKGIEGYESFCDFDQCERAATPAGEFTLEYYGLVDPTRLGRGSRPWATWIGLLVAAVGSLLIGRWLRHRARRSP